MDSSHDFPGSNTAAYFAARGVHLSPDEAAAFVRLLLHLADLGAISGRADARAAYGRPQDARRTCGRGTPEARSDGGSDGCARVALEGPTVYNMGPSAAIGAQT
jgi:hypothetical protein